LVVLHHLHHVDDEHLGCAGTLDPISSSGLIHLAVAGPTLSSICLVSDFKVPPTYRGALSDAELRLLPLLTTQLSMNQIAETLDVPRGVAMAIAQSIYAKLGPLGEHASRRLHSV
jgi:hypothetical protein